MNIAYGPLRVRLVMSLHASCSGWECGGLHVGVMNPNAPIQSLGDPSQTRCSRLVKGLD